jgi:hypothetical protein
MAKRKAATEELKARAESNGDLWLGPWIKYLNWLLDGVYEVQSYHRMSQGPVHCPTRPIASVY